MKARIKQVVLAYKTLGDAKVTKLEDGEVIKVVKARKAMRPIVEEYDAFLNDCQEKFKPEGWDEMQGDLLKWQEEGESTTLSEERRIELNKALVVYQKKIEAAVKEENEKEVELDVEHLVDESLIKMLQENGWELKKLDEFDFLS